MGNEDVEIELLKYLREEHADRAARKEHDAKRDRTLERVTNQLTVLDKKFDVQAAQNDARFRGLEARMSAVEADAEVTGNFRVDDLKAKLATAQAEAVKVEQEKALLEQQEKARILDQEKARQEAQKWWRQQWVQWVAAVVLIFVGNLAARIFVK